MDLGAYGSFVAAIWLFLMIPGPGNLALIAATSKGGMRGGLVCTLGVMAGDQVLMWSAVAGLSAMLMTMPALFDAVQWLGAIYLMWMGARLLWSRAGAAQGMQFRARHFWTQGFLITLFNPKAIVFYMAFFPMFIQDPEQATFKTFALMAVTVGALTWVYGLLAAWVTLRLAGQVKSKPWIARWLQRLAGMALVAFGVRMVMR